MRDRNSDDLTSWEKAFVSLNEKLGNNVWGIRQESDGSSGFRLRIYINDESLEDEVLKETNGILDGYSLVFTVYDQHDHALAESTRAMNDVLQRKVEEHAKAEATTHSTDGDVQGNSG